MLTAAQREHFDDQGYVVIEGIAPPLLESLRAAANRVTERARQGQWPRVRAAGAGDIWGVSNLLDPALGERAFGQYMATDEVLEVAADLIGHDQLRLSLTNMLVNPERQDYAICWHRDAADPSLEGEAELAFLRQHMSGVQWNAALYEEDCLLIVPASHRRNLTAEERQVLRDGGMGAMPGELRVRLRPGQAVYYRATLLHRGVYPTAVRRRTLHANLVSRQNPKEDNFPMHYESVKFMADPGFRATVPPRLHPLLDRWLEFAQQFQGAKDKVAR